MIIVLLLLFQSLCLYCQRLVLYVHDRCFPKNVRLLQEVAETVGDRKAVQRLAEQQLEQQKRSQKRRILEPILPLVGGVNSEACRFCAHSPQGYCRHHFHLQELQLHKQRFSSSGEQDFRQLRRIKRELKRSIGQQQQQHHHQPVRSYRPLRLDASWSSSSLSSGYASLSSNQEQEEETEYQEEQVLAEEENVEEQELPQEEEADDSLLLNTDM